MLSLPQTETPETVLSEIPTQEQGVWTDKKKYHSDIFSHSLSDSVTTVWEEQNKLMNERKREDQTQQQPGVGVSRRTEYSWPKQENSCTKWITCKTQ